MRLALLVGAAALVVGAALALVRVELVSAGEPGEVGKDRSGEGAPADQPQALLQE